MDSVGRYDSVARALHWLMALLVLLNLAVGFLRDGLEPVLGNLMPLHKSIGLTVLALTLVRIGWRLGHRPPALRGLPGWEIGLAHLTQFLLYGLMLLLPLSGWLMSSAGNRPLEWFGLFDVPKFAVTRDDAVVGLSRAGHGPMGWAMLVLALLHIAAALRHHFVLRNGILRRMW